ncbi:MAG: glycosyltransferase family 4 protein [Planctomycetaceae bacterium]
MTDRPLRILTVADVPADPNSGAAGKIVQSNRVLRELGHTVQELWSTDLGPRRIGHGNLHSLLEQPRRMRSAVLRAISSERLDVILSHQPQSYLAAEACRRVGFPGRFFVVSQGVEARIAPILTEWHRKLRVPQARFPQSLLSPWLQRRLLAQWPRACRACDGVIVDNREDQDFVIENYDVPHDRTLVWPSGLPEEFLHDPPPMTRERLRRILYVGQFAFYKGPHLLAEIVSQVLRSRPDMRMTWVCQAEHHEAARRLLSPDVHSQVEFRSWMPFAELRNLFDTHGLFLFPSIAEGFGRAALEAMSRGLCVIASDGSGMRDYIESGVNGWLHPIGDISRFVTGTRSMADGFDLAATMSARARVAASEFDWAVSVADLCSFLYRLPTASTSNKTTSIRDRQLSLRRQP